MNRRQVICLILIMVFLFALVGCINGNNNVTTYSEASNATATFGANQFHVQLTRMAEFAVTPAP